MKSLLYLTLRVFSQLDGAHPRSKHDMIEGAKEYIKDHSHQDLKVDDVARFRTGITPGEYRERLHRPH